MIASSIAHALGLKRAGREYTGACPCCGYKSGFTVTEHEGRLLLYCAAGGCSQSDLWAALRKLGLAPEEDRKAAEPSRKRKHRKPSDAPTITSSSEGTDNKDNAVAALWRRSKPIGGTVAEAYLRARGYTGPLPSVLRLAYGKHPSGDGYHPMLVAAVVLEGRLDQGVALHRTFLRPDGSGKAELEPNKMTLGPCKGGAVPLAPASPVIAVSEGIESGLSYMELAGIPTWAALSTSGIRNLILPPEVREVTIACDPDIPGIRAAYDAAEHWIAEGRRVRIARPPVGFDFNDILLQRVA
jgi:putative DNA primase/helicase